MFWQKAVVVITLICLFLVSSAHAWASWILNNAAKVADDVAFARQGLMLREQLPRDAVIAAGWLGSPAYFSGLKTIDLLGKTDAHVAHLSGTLPFRPGHNKMDLAYSVGELQPDLILIDQPELERYGYERLPNGLWVRAGFSVQRPASVLGDSWCASPADSVYCPRQRSPSR